MLANQLTCHLELENADHRKIVQNFWRSPQIADRPGLKAVDLFSALGEGRIMALWIMGTNPVDSMPDADGVRAALQACPFVVVSDVVRWTDITALADVLLPSTARGEKVGTVTNSERCISRQRSFLPSPGKARPDWWQLAQVARRMGFSQAFSYEHPAEIFAEYAELSGLESGAPRDFDISACAAISRNAYDRLEPLQWPYRAACEAGETRFFADGGFFTSDPRARFIATSYRAPATAASSDFPYLLNTGRIRDQWHTMTRTGTVARLMQHFAELFVEIHPDDALRVGIKSADLCVLRSALGSITVRAQVDDRQRPGSVFVPMHWTDLQASSARVDRLIAARIDPVSGQPELKFTPVALTPFASAWHGFAVISARPRHIIADYWAIAPAKAGWRIELAGARSPRDWTGFARTLLLPDADAGAGRRVRASHDANSGQHRIALFRDARLLGALFVAASPVAVSRSWAVEQLSARLNDPAARLRVLAGRAGGAVVDKGPLVCACHEVGINQIAEAGQHYARSHRQDAWRRHELWLVPSGNQENHR